MKLPVYVPSSVEADLLAISAELEAIREGLGREFEEEIQRLFELIVEFPKLYVVYVQPIRKAPLLRFNYHIYYAIEANRIVVLAIRDSRRKPPRRSDLGN